MKKSIISLMAVMIISLTVNTPFVEAAPKNAAAADYTITDSAWVAFQNGSTDFWHKEMANDTYSGSVSDNYKYNGIPAYRMEVRNTDSFVNGSYRSEIATAKPEPAADERTYNFSVLLPKGGDEDFTLDPKGDEIIAQWHNTPDPGEDWTYPPLSLHTSGDGHYHLYVCWDDQAISTSEKMDAAGKVKEYDLGSYLTDKGNWTDWSFHVKWGWKDSQHPSIQVYKNGKMLFELKGPNTTNDKVGVHMKLGIYKNQWKVKNNPSIVTKRIVYYNNVSIN